MGYATAFPLLAAVLVGSLSLPESAKAQTNPYALDRLFLESNDDTPLYQVLSFDSETEVANYYGNGSPEAHLATEFFANYSGSSANMLFTRYPVLPARAHLYGANISGMTLSELENVDGTLKITSEGYKYSGSVNLSGVTSFSAAATAMRDALNRKLPVAAVTTGSSIKPVSVSFTGSISQEVLDVTSLPPGSRIEIGSYISGPGVPPGTQITSQLSGTTGGVGDYGFFVREGTVPSETLTESYGVLKVGSVSSGAVAVGQQVTNGSRGSADNILPHTAIEDHLNGSGAGSTWVVDYAQTVANEGVTMTGAPLAVTYRHVKGPTGSTAYFLIQQWPDVNWISSSLSYMGGSAAADLGLTEAAGAFDSTPGQIVTDPSEWMNNLVAPGNPEGSDQWSSVQFAYDNRAAIPPGAQRALADWAKTTDGQYKFLWASANTPPIVNSAPSVPQWAPMGTTVPEPSTWAMMAIGFAGLGFARYWRTKASRTTFPASMEYAEHEIG